MDEEYFRLLMQTGFRLVENTNLKLVFHVFQKAKICSWNNAGNSLSVIFLFLVFKLRPCLLQLVFKRLNSVQKIQPTVISSVCYFISFFFTPLKSLT